MLINGRFSESLFKIQLRLEQGSAKVSWVEGHYTVHVYTEVSQLLQLQSDLPVHCEHGLV